MAGVSVVVVVVVAENRTALSRPYPEDALDAKASAACVWRFNRQ